MANKIDIIIRATDATAKAWKSVKSGAAKMAAGLKSALGGIYKTVGQVAKAITVMGAAAGLAARKFIQAASDAEEIDTKFKAVYRSALTAAKAVSKDLAKSFDLADSSAKKMLADTGDLLTGFGFTAEEALDLANKVNTLAIDLASFTNYSKGATGASEALTKLLLGESEQAKSLGIVVRQTSDEYKTAVKETMALKGVTELQAKAMVALEMATAQSKNAIGDYARTQDGVANRTRTAAEAIKEAKEQIGQAIIDNADYAEILEKVATAARDLSESGYIELWAKNAKIAIQEIRAEGGALITLLKGINDATQTLAGAGGVQSVKQKKKSMARKLFERTPLGSLLMLRELAASAGEASVTTSDYTTDKELAAIKRERAERQKLQDEKDKAEEADAIEDQAGTESSDAIEDQAGTESSVAIEDQAGTDEDAAIDAQGAFLDEIEASERAREKTEKLTEARKELARVNKQLAAVGDEAHEAESQAQLDQAEKDQADARAKLDELTRTKEERRADDKKQRDADYDERRAERLRAKERKGGRIGRSERDFLDIMDQRDKIKDAEQAADVARKNLEEAARTKAEDQRKEQIARLRKIEETLITNLQASGG